LSTVTASSRKIYHRKSFIDENRFPKLQLCATGHLNLDSKLKYTLEQLRILEALHVFQIWLKSNVANLDCLLSSTASRVPPGHCLFTPVLILRNVSNELSHHGPKSYLHGRKQSSYRSGNTGFDDRGGSNKIARGKLEEWTMPVPQDE
jgi:hypothetical protein